MQAGNPMKYIDISLTISEDSVVWPGSKKPVINPYQRIINGNASNNSEIEMDLHTGTHFDAPLHFRNSGKNTEQVDISGFIGECYVADLTGNTVITQNTLEKAGIPETERLLIKAGNSKLYSRGIFIETYTALDQTAAEWIINRNISLIGIDYLSVERYHDSTFPAHKILLTNETIILEGLDLTQAKEGFYTLLAMPIRINNVEAAPVRAVLLPKDTLNA